MVIKSTKLRVRKKQISSSESESSVAFSESSNEELPVLKLQTGVKQPVAPVFVSPALSNSPRLAVHPQKVVRTYGTKFVFWESIASSTPLIDRPANLKLAPFSPINSSPSPSEAIINEEVRENSEDWCTYVTEENLPRERPSKHVRGSLQKRNLVDVKEKRNVSVLPFENLSPKVVNAKNVSVKQVINSLHESSLPSKADARNKHHSKTIKSSEIVSNSSKLQHIHHGVSDRSKLLPLEQEEAVEVNNIANLTDCKTHKRKYSLHKEKVNSSFKEVIVIVPEKRVTRQSKIPVEWISKSQVGPRNVNQSKLNNSSQKVAVNHSITINNKENVSTENVNLHNQNFSPLKSVRFENNEQTEREVSVEQEIGSFLIENAQKSAEELLQHVTSPVNSALEVSEKRDDNEENLDSAPSRKTRGNLKKMQKAANTDRIEHKKGVLSESPADVHVASEKTEQEGTNVHSRTSVKKLEQKNVIDNTKRKRRTRSSIKRLSIEDVDSEPNAAVHVASEKTEQEGTNVHSRTSIKKLEQKTVVDNSKRLKDTRSSIKRLSIEDVDSEPHAAVHVASEISEQEGTNVHLTTSVKKLKQKNVIDNTKRKKDIRNSIKRLSTEDVDSEPNAAVHVASEKTEQEGTNVHSRTSVKKLQQKTVIDNSKRQKDTRSTFKRLSIEDVDSESHAAVHVASEKTEKEGTNVHFTSSVKKLKQKKVIDNTKRKKYIRSSIKRLSIEDDDSGTRKSKRQRLAPVQYWKGERVQYENVEHSECKLLYKIVGVVRPRVEDVQKNTVDSAPGDKLKKKEKYVKQTGRNRRDQHPHDTFSLSRNISVSVDVREKIPLRINEKTQDVECVAHFVKNAFEPYVLDSGKSISGIQYQSCLSVNGFTNGFMKIEAGACLENEVNEDTDLVLFAVKGRVHVTINGCVILTRPGSSVFVPRGIQYQIENNSSSETLLYYVTKNVHENL